MLDRTNVRPARSLHRRAAAAIVCGLASTLIHPLPAHAQVNVTTQHNDPARTAIGEITGALADSAGNVLGQVDEELAVPISNVMSTCNQLQMDLAAIDAVVLQVPLHFDKQVAGFDSREGTTPRAIEILCAAAELVRGKPTAEALVRGLNTVATALASKPAR